VYGELQKTLDPNNSFLTHESGTTRDQLSTVYQAVIPRGFSGWGNISTLGFSLPAAMAAKLAYPERQCVAVVGDAGLSYILGNMEALLRYQIGVTFVHINNGGFAAYGPGFWGGGHDPYTYEVLDHTKIDMSGALADMGYYSERVTEPSEVASAIERALAQNEDGQPAYLEIICSMHPVFPRFVTG
jgi:acetolactate synthase-1/2/3 large subunit